MSCDSCGDLGVNVAALPEVVDPKMTLRDAVGLYGVCPECAEEASAGVVSHSTEARLKTERGGVR